MPGPRQSLEVLEGKGRKHLSRSERAQRAAGEVRPAPPKQLRAPEYLTAELKEQFRALARQLKELGLLSSLDYDTLARYLLARQDVYKRQGHGHAGGPGAADLCHLQH